MQRYIAFLSGLPTGPGAIPQERLRGLFFRLGFLNVETHGTTGNVAFETAPVGVTAALEAQISRHLKNTIKSDIWTFLRTPEYLEQVVARAPFSDDADNSRFIVFLSEPLDARTQQKLSGRRSRADMLHPKGLEIYWERRIMADAGPPLALSDFLDSPATVRSYSTITSLVAEYVKPSGRKEAALTESERSRL